MVTSFPGLMFLMLLLNKAKKLIVTSSALTLFDLTYSPCCRVGTTVTFESWVQSLSKPMEMNKKVICVFTSRTHQQEPSKVTVMLIQMLLAEMTFLGFGIYDHFMGC